MHTATFHINIPGNPLAGRINLEDIEMGMDADTGVKARASRDSMTLMIIVHATDAADAANWLQKAGLSDHHLWKRRKRPAHIPRRTAMSTAQIIIPFAAARAAATKAGWPADACSTAWLESRIDAVFSRKGNGDIKVEVEVEVEIEHLPTMAQLIHDVIA